MQTLPEDTFEVTDTADQYLTFFLGEEEYGVAILAVREIRSWRPCTPLPRAPDYVMGVMNLRGAIVPIINLRRRLGLPPVACDDTTAVIIVSQESEQREQVVGLVVDRVSEVYHLGVDTIQATTDPVGIMRSEFISGIGQMDEKMVIVLDLGPIVSPESESKA